MLILRLFILLVLLVLVLTGGMYLYTGNRRYLDLAWKTVRLVLLVLAMLALLFVLERYVLVGWGVLL